MKELRPQLGNCGFYSIILQMIGIKGLASGVEVKNIKGMQLSLGNIVYSVYMYMF